jgi:formylglycine-generating enzyme
MTKLLILLAFLLTNSAIFSQAPGPSVPKKATATIPAAQNPASTKPKINKPEIEWVSIPGGTFTMGSPANEVLRDDNETPHQVTLSAFKMSKYEVTFAQYDAFCNATGHKKPKDKGWGRGKRPVINVNWDDATAFAEWMGCRLPTEAEWEYACRAGTTTPYNTGNTLTKKQANFDGVKTMPVGSYAPNAWGLHDMHGNVWEWCSDLYGEYFATAQTNPQGASTGGLRVLRGGSWYKSANRCLSAYRYLNSAEYSAGVLGFRVVSGR